MSRTALLCGAVLVVVVTSACADEPSFGFTGDFYRIAPTTLYGELPETSISVEAASPLEYYFYTTDVDSVQEYELGEPLDDPVNLPAYSAYHAGLTQINSCPTPAFTHDSEHEMDTVETNVWRLNGGPQGPLEQAQHPTDYWYAQDLGSQASYPDEGTTDDPNAGSYSMAVTVTPNCGWIYGTVSMGGNGVQGASVKVYVGTELIREGTSGAGGAYEFHLLAAGTYTVKASTPMGKKGQANATVTKGAGTQANIALN